MENRPRWSFHRVERIGRPDNGNSYAHDSKTYIPPIPFQGRVPPISHLRSVCKHCTLEAVWPLVLVKLLSK